MAGGQLSEGVCRHLVDLSSPRSERVTLNVATYYVQVIRTEEPEGALRKIYIHDGVEKIFVYCKATHAVTWENGSILSISNTEICEKNPMNNILACEITIDLIQRGCEQLVDLETLTVIKQDDWDHRCWKCGNWDLKAHKKFGKWKCPGEKEFQGCEKYMLKNSVVSFYCSNCKHRMCSLCLGKYGSKKVSALGKRKLDHISALMSTLWEEKEDTGDITIKCSDGDMKCHKTILSSQPSFFKTAVGLPMRESNEGIIDFTELADKKLLLLVLEWIYFGALTAKDPDLLKLFNLAAYCQLPKLVDHIATRLVAIVTADNVKAILKTFNAHKSLVEVKTLRERLTTRISEDKDLLQILLFPS